MYVDVQGQNITVERLEIERRLLIVSTEDFAADESHDQLRTDVSLELVASLWLYSPVDREAILKDVLTYGCMAVPLANS